MKNLVIAFLSSLFIVVFSLPARAQTLLIPVSGTLSNNEGVPLEGLCWIRLAIYATLDGAAPLYSETQEIMVEHGAFTAYMGSLVALDLSIFNGQDLYLGIKLGADDEMTPLLPFGSVPYALYAREALNAQEAINAQEAVHAQEAALAQDAISSRETLAVPSGAVMYFDLAACPQGWSELTAARGRTIVALPSGGTLARHPGLGSPRHGDAYDKPGSGAHARDHASGDHGLRDHGWKSCSHGGSGSVHNREWGESRPHDPWCSGRCLYYRSDHDHKPPNFYRYLKSFRGKWLPHAYYQRSANNNNQRG